MSLDKTPLGRYTNSDGDAREIILINTSDARRLVIDRSTSQHDDVRLVGELAAEEPNQNAELLAALYLDDETRGRCRPVHPEDLQPKPTSPALEHSKDRDAVAAAVQAGGAQYALVAIPSEPSGPSELRWARVPDDTDNPTQPMPVTLRDVVGQAESYEPASSMTATALAHHRDDADISTVRLAAELHRLLNSTIVLNRGVREAVKRDVATGDLSLSAIAHRCGRVKQDRRGNSSGETSWLARRIGEMPEGNGHLTPWIHSDTLALIARDGLGRDPRELELH
jgi:hypothetical protein